MLEKTALRFLGLAGEISAIDLAWLSGVRLSIKTPSTTGVRGGGGDLRTE